jgi:hypothetical protein
MVIVGVEGNKHIAFTRISMTNPSDDEVKLIRNTMGEQITPTASHKVT